MSRGLRCTVFGALALAVGLIGCGSDEDAPAGGGTAGSGGAGGAAGSAGVSGSAGTGGAAGSAGSGGSAGSAGSAGSGGSAGSAGSGGSAGSAGSGGSAGSAGAGPDLITIDDLQYQGAFRLSTADAGSSSIDYAVGTLAYNPQNHSLFIAGHAQQNMIAEYPVPVPGTQAAVADLPVGDPPLQPFADVINSVPNPEAIDRVTGMLWVDGALIVNAETWYDAAGDNADTTVVVDDADDLAGATRGYFELDGAANSGGYMGSIPAVLQSDFAAAFYTGWSSVYSIVSRYSVGPSLWTFAPSDAVSGDPTTSPHLPATSWMNYRYSDGHYLSDRALEWGAQGTPGPFPPSSPLWNPLSKGVYGFFVEGTYTFAVIGSTAGLTSGIGYKAVQSDGHVCGGPCPYEPDDVYNYYWLFDVRDILTADDVYDPQPYDYGVWEVPFDDAGHHAVIGGTLDTSTGTLYVALESAAQVGTYDRPPLIVTYSLPQ